MSLLTLMGAFPLKTANNSEFEEKRMTREEKASLDRAISNELKQGWRVKSRSHEAEGRHGVTLVRKKQRDGAVRMTG